MGYGVPNRGQLLSTIPQVSVNSSLVANTNPKNSVSVNVPGILSSVDNTVFPRVDPKSTVGAYPNIDTILVNQKEDNDLMEKELSKEDDNLSLRSGALNTLQNSLVDACQMCVPGKCRNCPICLNGRTSHPSADSVASNKVDALSVGNLSDENEYMTIENFDSNLRNQCMPSKVHNKIKKKI